MTLNSHMAPFSCPREHLNSHLEPLNSNLRAPGQLAPAAAGPQAVLTRPPLPRLPHKRPQTPPPPAVRPAVRRPRTSVAAAAPERAPPPGRPRRRCCGSCCHRHRHRRPQRHDRHHRCCCMPLPGTGLARGGFGRRLHIIPATRMYSLDLGVLGSPPCTYLLDRQQSE